MLIKRFYFIWVLCLFSAGAFADGASDLQAAKAAAGTPEYAQLVKQAVDSYADEGLNEREIMQKMFAEGFSSNDAIVALLAAGYSTTNVAIAALKEGVSEVDVRSAYVAAGRRASDASYGIQMQSSVLFAGWYFSGRRTASGSPLRIDPITGGLQISPS